MRVHEGLILFGTKILVLQLVLGSGIQGFELSWTSCRLQVSVSS